MTIGQALKRKREDLGLSQEQMAAGIISRAQYGKIEKDQHDISFAALLSILCAHNIDITSFINQIDSHLVSHYKLEEPIVSSQLVGAFYENNPSTINSLQEKINASENEELKIIAQLERATLENNYDDLDSSIVKKIQEYIFSDENWTSDIVALRYFGSSMPLLPRYYLDLHIKQLLKKYAKITNYPLETQERICAIGGNYLFNTYQEPDSFLFQASVTLLKSSLCHPHLWQYKVIAQYFEYYVTQNKAACDNILQILKSTHEEHLLNTLPILS